MLEEILITYKGKEYARVSEILQPLTNFGHINPEVLANKQMIGTDVHEAIHSDMIGQFPMPEPVSLGYFWSYQKWMETLKPRIICSEERYYCHDKMITGCIDALISINGSSSILVDFKTSVSESSTWIKQAHLYSYLILSTHKCLTLEPRYLFIQLDKHGALPKVYEYKHDPRIHNECMQHISDYWKKRS